MQTSTRSTSEQHHKHESVPTAECPDRGMLDAGPRTYVITQNRTHSSLSLKQYTTEVAMKTTMLVLNLLATILIVGCQDNSITDPITAAASEGQQLSKPQPVNSLALHAIVREPGNDLNSFVEITGVVAYQTILVPLDPIPPNPQFAVILTLNADAEVRSYNPRVPFSPVWHVLGSSTEWVPVPESGNAFVTKSYKINGRSDGMLLKVKFQVTLTSVELSSMWLELPRVGRVEDLD